MIDTLAPPGSETACCTGAGHRSLVYAIYQATIRGSTDPAGPFQVYPCWCGLYHVDRPKLAPDRTGVRRALERLGWRRASRTWEGRHVETWVSPVDGAVFDLKSAWLSAHALAGCEARVLVSKRPAAQIARECADQIDSDADRRAMLEAAGWRQVNNPRVERWLAPSRQGRLNGGSKKKTLEQAWAAYRRGH